SWPAPASDAGMSWTNTTTELGVLSLGVPTTANPVAFRVTAVYVDSSGASVESVGVYEVDVSSGLLSVASLFAGEPPITSPTPLGSLPVTVLLETVPVGSSA
ncbi:MAG: hypothetical protein L3K09_04495, partial [Thermoplasmata archaeon]|nr:hypothetical protein [Thermoplasmata archaeon]